MASLVEKTRVLIIGGGIMGSASAWAMACQAAGKIANKNKNIEITMVEAGNTGSSKGETRVARIAAVDPVMLPMMRRSFRLYQRLEEDTGKQLMHRLPIVDIFPNMQKFPKIAAKIKGLAGNYEKLGIEYEMVQDYTNHKNDPLVQKLAAQGILLREGKDSALFMEGEGKAQEIQAAAILASDCVAAFHAEAVKLGVRWNSGEKVEAIDRGKKSVTTSTGKTYPYDKLVICGGPWTNSLLQRANLPLLPLIVSNEQNVYYNVLKSGGNGKSRYLAADHTPIVVTHWPKMYQLGGNSQLTDASSEEYDKCEEKHSFVYVVPQIPNGETGVKMGAHRQGKLIKNDEEFICRAGIEADVAGLSRLPNYQADNSLHTNGHWTLLDEHMKSLTDEAVNNHFPDLDTANSHHVRCLYTHTTLNNENFLIGKFPASTSAADAGAGAGENMDKDMGIYVAAGFAGEGFKFGPVVGEIMASLVLGLPDDPDSTQFLKDAQQRFSLDQAF